ncbi:MAG: hypothetical protein U5K75_02535 [Ahrensia sp.]|nr:hypothetical protein [Ahrensia sp.]
MVKFLQADMGVDDTRFFDQWNQAAAACLGLIEVAFEPRAVLIGTKLP